MAKAKARTKQILARDIFRPDPSPIIYVDPDFLKYFGKMAVKEQKVLLGFRELLRRPMTSEEILKKWKPSPTTLGILYYNIRHNAKLLRGGGVNIFYVPDVTNTLRAVYVRWYDDGWFVFAGPVGHSGGWGAAYRIFSRKFSSSLPA